MIKTLMLLLVSSGVDLNESIYDIWYIDHIVMPRHELSSDWLNIHVTKQGFR